MFESSNQLVIGALAAFSFRRKMGAEKKNFLCGVKRNIFSLKYTFKCKLRNADTSSKCWDVRFVHE